MKELISWLRSLEQSALYFYSKASRQIEDNPHLESLLRELATDEAFHFNTLGDVAQLIESLNLVDQLDIIKIDKALIESIQEPLDRARQDLENNNLSEQELLSAMVEFESSEINDLFLYVVEHCEQYSKIFKKAVFEIRHHKNRIVEFLEELPEQRRPPNFTDLPPSLKKDLLLLEGDPGTAALYRKLLSRFINVTIPKNEMFSLEEVLRGRYDVILCDMSDPGKNIFKMYFEALKSDPILSQRLIVIADHKSSDIKELSSEFKIPLLHKPIELFEVKSLIEQITRDGKLSM